MRDKQTINRGRKFDQVREGASGVFMRDGYAAASVDDIARAARVSKATLYSYFPDKKLMFQEVVEAAMAQVFRSTPFEIDRYRSVRPGLSRALHDLATLLLLPEVLQFHRVVLAEATRFPAAAAAYRDLRDRTLLTPLAEQLDRWVARGELEVENSACLARQLLSLFAADLQQTALLSGPEQFSPDHIAASADRAAELVLRAHGTPGLEGGA